MKRLISKHDEHLRFLKLVEKRALLMLLLVSTRLPNLSRARRQNYISMNNFTEQVTEERVLETYYRVFDAALESDVRNLSSNTFFLTAQGLASAMHQRIRWWQHTLDNMMRTSRGG